MSSRKCLAGTAPAPPRNPADGHPGPWPPLMIIVLVVAGLVWPLVTFAGAVAAFAFAEEEQGTLLIGAGLVHVLLGLTLLAGLW